MNTQSETDNSQIRDQVQTYYGKVLASSDDLQTNACCPAGAVPTYLRPYLAAIHDDIHATFYGCGTPLPPDLTGRTVLDLGSGSGRDAYLLSQLVGPTGQVIGVDMTEEQLAIANRYLDHHAKAFGFANVRFEHGYIEDLASAGIADNSVDLVVSNCVINLSPMKDRVFREIFRVLKPGGELYFSDVYADRRIPEALRADPVIHGECLGGALYGEDFRRLMADAGCADLRVVERHPLTVENPELQARLGLIGFESITVRAFKLPLEDRCEDYGQVATYLGTVPECPHFFELDDHHLLETGRPMLVCGNTADMLSQTHYARHFRVLGDKSTHFGIFAACDSTHEHDHDQSPAETSDPSACSGGSCC